MRHSKLLCQKANAGVACARREVRGREESRIYPFRPRRQKPFCQRVNVGMVLRFCRPYIDEKNFYFDTQRLPLPYKGGMGAWPHVHPKLLTFCPHATLHRRPSAPARHPFSSLRKGVWGLGPHVHPKPLTFCPSNAPSPSACPCAPPIFSLHKGGMGAWPPCQPKTLVPLPP